MHKVIEEIRDGIANAVPDYEGRKFVLAVSGGLDSMVLAYACVKLRISFSIAHCNYQLRGYESDEDERFVRSFAADNGVPFHCTKFDTNDEKKGGESIQMVARRLRYTWFEELKNEHGYDYLLLAHHLDDQIESFFINFLRGTGIKGLIGMKSISDYRVRPMLDLAKNDLEQYANYLEMEYREDSSNREFKYVRNKIRHHVMPLLKEIRPEVYDIFLKNSEKLSLAQEALDEGSANMAREFNNENINFSKFKSFPAYYQIDYLQQFGFNVTQYQNLLESSSGAKFYSDDFQLLVDRESFSILPITSEEDKPQLILNLNSNENNVLELEVKTGMHIDSQSERVGNVDFAKIQFPLIYRKWEFGDSFIPLGMKGKKKLSDYFIDEKFSAQEKDAQRVLINGDGKIIWLANRRVSEEFKVTSKTSETLVVVTKAD